ncbi:leucine-rich repeat receptor-like protein kinase [Vitis vinifera]|uniref:Leucine-rich repeat receptor-like protein kinase n=1 Tax=Vitis vinifera TaxID=29760 RepID=A0A438GDA6_VITVI|nr:leucine-rich repeat receptor-like protein kinase [Vitis vinifera]
MRGVYKTLRAAGERHSQLTVKEETRKDSDRPRSLPLSMPVVGGMGCSEQFRKYSSNKVTMFMSMDKKTILLLLPSFLCCLLSSTSTSSSIDQGDLSCLRSIKSSVEDPFGSLNTWSFDNIGIGDICMLNGIACWSYFTDRVQTIQLQGLGLKGKFPQGIRNCTSLTTLDLSNNNFFGPIPSNINQLIPYVRVLNLSYNKILGYCSFYVRLYARGTFNQDASDKKEKQEKRSPSSDVGHKEENEEKGTSSNENIANHKDFYDGETRYQNAFDRSRCCNEQFQCREHHWVGKTGTMYKAAVMNGCLPAVKRFLDSQQFEKQFIYEILILGRLTHPNLVPLLGFCIERNEKLLVYEHMGNGNLYQWLHPNKAKAKILEWPLRGRIGVGLARGLAWLHHNCMFLKDVYSFGIVLLEMVTRKKPHKISDASRRFDGTLVDWINHLLSTSGLYDAIDKSLIGQGFDGEIFEFLKVACSCVKASPHRRPTMLEVDKILRNTVGRHQIDDDSESWTQNECGTSNDRDEYTAVEIMEESIEIVQVDIAHS